MRNFLKLLILTLILSSCAVKHNHDFRTAPGDPRYNNYFELGLDDIQYLGEVEISYEFTRYLGFIVRMIGINEERPNKAEIHYAYPAYTFLEKLAVVSGLDARGLSRAMYKVYTEFPDANYTQIVQDTKTSHRMFGGVKIKRSARVKVYKFRD